MEKNRQELETMQTISLDSLFYEAVESLPYTDCESTGYTQGDLESLQDGTESEYSEEFTFTAGTLLDEHIIAGGWVELRKDDDDITISAFFGLSRNGDWEHGRILREYEALQGWYNLETKKWTLEIGTY
jgi:hypothetical protein